MKHRKREDNPFPKRDKLRKWWNEGYQWAEMYVMMVEPTEDVKS
jgi:hypothetical protein